MKANTQLFGGVIYSQRVMLALIEKGLSREDAYKIAQTNAHKAWNQPNGDFRENLYKDEVVKKFLSKVEIDECFEPEYYLRNVSKIYERFEV